MNFKNENSVIGERKTAAKSLNGRMAAILLSNIFILFSISWRKECLCDKYPETWQKERPYDSFSDFFNKAIIGHIKIPQKKLLTPWIKSHGSPAIIHATIPLKSKPNKRACAGA